MELLSAFVHWCTSLGVRELLLESGHASNLTAASPHMATHAAHSSSSDTSFTEQVRQCRISKQEKKILQPHGLASYYSADNTHAPAQRGIGILCTRKRAHGSRQKSNAARAYASEDIHRNWSTYQADRNGKVKATYGAMCISICVYIHDIGPRL